MLTKLIDYPGPLWRLYSVLATLLLVLSVIFWGTVILISLPLGSTRKQHTKMIRIWMHFVVGIFRIRFKITGAHNHDPNSPSLVVSNHQSLFDIPSAFMALDGDIRMVAKKSLFHIPFFGWAIIRIDFIPLERGNSTSGQEASKAISEKIRSGVQVWVAPEGTRSVGANLGPFKKGSFAVAIEAHVPVQPILVENSYEAVPKKSLLVRPGVEIRIQVLPRISTEGLTIQDRAKLAETVRFVMLEKLKEAEAARGLKPAKS